MKVAILQNQVIKGGRFSVIARMVKNLNEIGIIPDLLTQKIGFDLNQTKDLYGFDIKLNVVRAWSFNKFFPEFDILKFNKNVHPQLKNYDLVLNSNNTSHFLSHPNLIEYVHFPRYTRVLKKEALNGLRGITFWMKFIELKIVSSKYRKSIYPKCTLLANSQFTASTFMETYGEEHKISVLYPPVAIGENKISFKANSNVVCLGRIHPSKKQLEIVKLAKQLINFNFFIVGFAKQGDSYLEECRNYIKANNVENVQIIPNALVQERDEILRNSSYFLHLLEDEPFGISTVQAIEFGCIPIVPNSGGQIEIVTEERLRFNSLDEIPSILSNMSNSKEEEKEQILERLFLNIDNFSNQKFDKQFLELIQKYVNQGR